MELLHHIIPELSSLILIFIGIALALKPFRGAIENGPRAHIYQICISLTSVICGFLLLTSNVVERTGNEQSMKTLIQRTTNTVDNTNTLVQETKQLANSANAINDGIQDTLARLARMQPVVDDIRKAALAQGKRLEDQRFVDMPQSQLAESANSIADFMKDWAYSYSIQDRQLSLVYYDRLEGMGSRWTQRQQKDWLAETGRKRKELLATYEPQAQTFVNTANRIRKVMLDKLSPLERTTEDQQAQTWFENPAPDLLQLAKMGDYLKKLAARMLSNDKPSRTGF